MIAPLAHAVVGAEDQLTEADGLLLALQRAAGADLGDPLAIPQIAALVRSARALGIRIDRQVLAASNDEDFDLSMIAELREGLVHLALTDIRRRPAASPRFDDSVSDRPAARPVVIRLDQRLAIDWVAPALAARLGDPSGNPAGRALTDLFRLIEAEDGSYPLISALADQSGLETQLLERRSDGSRWRLSALRREGEQGGFCGLDGWLSPVDEAAPAGAGQLVDAALSGPLDEVVRAADQIADQSEGPLRRDYAGYAADIASAARHLQGVVRAAREGDSSGLSRMDAGQIAQQAAALVAAAAEEAGVPVRVERGPVRLYALGDARATVQILVNLLGNAIRHSPAGLPILLAIAEDGDGVLFSVVDQGPGIAEADAQRIFERYERADNLPGGTGLGLAISRRLARAMGGDVALAGAGPGAHFILRVPRSNP